MKTLLALLVGLVLGGIAVWYIKESPSAVAPEPLSPVEKLLESQKEVKSLPFPSLVHQVTGKQVLAADAEAQLLVQAIHDAAEKTRHFLNDPDGPARTQRRINEVSRFAEEYLMEALNQVAGLHCEFPTNAKGKTQRSGYPDLKVTDTTNGRVAYVDPKLYEAGSESSTLRTFYFQPKRETSKILQNAYHFLVGFRHDGKTGAWHFDTFNLVDLHEFQIGLKVEFQGSNRDLYRDELIVKPRID
ncbi:MAG: hypothetical protein ACI9DF_005461 [Verrucomicrobiales bacterium]|jgi:hypothetical protein